MKWIVFWWRQLRLGSVELTDENWAIVKEEFIFNTLQTDVTGTVHIEITGMRR